jgi:hypothetical protein
MAPDLAAERVDDSAAGHGLQGRKGTHDAAVPEHAGQGPGKADLTDRRFARFELVAVEKKELGQDLSRTMMKMHFRAVLQGVGRRRQAGHLHIPDHGRKKGLGMGQHLAALKLGHLKAIEIDGGALAGVGHFGGRAVHLQAAHLGAMPRRNDLDLLAQAQEPEMDVPVTTVPCPSW